jgi:transposase
MRLVLILDDETGLPVWYDIVPGNVLDFSLLSPIVKDVEESLDITIDDYVLDAGYVAKNLILEINLDTSGFIDINGEIRHKTLIARMPAKKGFPYKKLYMLTEAYIHDAEYDFTRSGHSYFGMRLETKIFDQREYAYVYVDKDNATRLFREYKENHEEVEKMSREEKNWEAVRQGFFIIVSNIEMTAAEMLDEYFNRTRIESVFKTSKEYLCLLPLAKWTNDTVRGKILTDIISTIVLIQARKKMGSIKLSSTKIIGTTQSLMCIKGKNGIVTVEPPKKQARLVYNMLKIKVPNIVDLSDFSKDVLLMN